MYQWLDRAPRGRNETGVCYRRHDEYQDSRDQPPLANNLVAENRRSPPGR